MRVMVVEPNPTFGGGCEGIILDLARQLARRGHELLLLHETMGSMVPAYEAFIADRVTAALPGFPRRRPDRALACVATVGRIGRAHHVDVMLSSNLTLLRVAAWAGAVYRTPWCFHLGLSGASHRCRLAVRCIAAGVAPSQHTAESWRRAGWPAERLHVIPNWVDPDRFAPPADRARLRRELGLPETGFYIVCVGRICREKGVEVLIEAFRRVAAAISNARLLLVGPLGELSGSSLGDLLAHLDPVIRARVIIRPATDSPERYLGSADLACIPSLAEESFGLSLLEGMASGLPVVATSVGAFDDIIGSGDADGLVPPGDAGALAAALHSWAQRPADASAYGRRLRERILRHFSPRPVVERYGALLDRIVRQRRERAGSRSPQCGSAA